MAQEYIERGDIYFFYRNKLGIEKASNIKDIQRLHLILLPDNMQQARLLIVGKKRMPNIIKGESLASERNWLMVSSVRAPAAIGAEMGPLAYKTETRGRQQQSEAIPAGAGRYVIFVRNDSTQLAYRLDLPKNLGRAQEQLRISKEAAYVLAIRNPGLDVPGFPDTKPDYPKNLRQEFADERWLPVRDSRLMDYEKAQLILIGAHSGLEELDIRITGESDLFTKLQLDARQWPKESLESGEFATVAHKPETKTPRADRSRGGNIGGAESLKTASAAGVAHALKGITFPKQKHELVAFADQADASNEIVKLPQELPGNKFESMADVTKAIGEVH